MSPLKDAVRQLERRPAFSFVIVAILAIGIGVTTGIFSLFQQILLRPLPVPEPDRLVNLVPSPVRAMSYAMFRDLVSGQDVFEGLAAYDQIDANLVFEDRPQSGSVFGVSGEYFNVLGLVPALGRLITPEDEPAVGRSLVAVIAHEHWQRALGGDPDIVGRTLTVNGHDLTIIGVAPAGFRGTAFGLRPQAFVPLTLRYLLRGSPAEQAQNRAVLTTYNPFARLKPGVEIEQAAAAIDTLYAGLIQAFEAESPFPGERRIALEPGAEGQRAATRNAFARPLVLLFGVTLVVLFVVCSNVACLLLARGTARANELAIRAAIGADRRRLVTQLLAEASLLALLGGLASLPIAGITVAGIAAFVPAGVVHEVDNGLGPAVVAFAAGASLVTVLAFGVAPALAASRGAHAAVAGPAAHSLGGRGKTRVHSALTTLQIALSLVLLVLAGLFAQSLANIARIDLGLAVESVVTFNVAPQRNGYRRARVDAVYRNLEASLAALPGVVGVGSAAIPLLTNSQWIRAADGLDAPPSVDTTVATNIVSPGLFATLGVPLLAGRDFAFTDTSDAPQVAIVNESFAARFGLGSDAIGRRFRPRGADADVEIVGVVADAAQSGAGVKAPVPPQFYQPMAQVDPSFVPSRHFYLRSAIAPESLLGAIRRAVADVDPNLPVSALRTLEAQFDDDVYVDRLVTALSASFSILATVLAAIGLYGMLSYSVAQRTRELGLRLTLGAVPARLKAMVLKRVGAMMLIGTALGVGAAIVLGRIVEAMLFGVSGYDPLAFAAAAAVLAVVVLAASYGPARRAASIAPMAALRYE